MIHILELSYRKKVGLKEQHKVIKIIRSKPDK